MMFLLVGGAWCSGILVAIFQFYLFKKALEPALENMLKRHPSYWDDPTLQDVAVGIRTKMIMDA